MRLTIRTNLAMRVLMACAVNEGHMIRRAGIAKAANASENHLAQVVHLLATGGYIETTRGRAGGIVLARAPDQISLGEVMRHFEAGVPFAECFADGANTCPLQAVCRLRVALTAALEAFYGVLDEMTLQDLVADNAGLDALLSLPQPDMMMPEGGCVQLRRVN
ncbi:RrF2 family transcriptional regulator [Celeribacter ethanolicus]|uniref:Rrf2 family transcriptional regulator n=1 Tax=Celeribacter ethanolicus TaxID=1758178 RepID=A0A291GHQ1_9RHOB|nr:Rrf2 family transcriptional regulator [Celeribacter ethanolicus]ATG49698.1 Rrf2 family transcriptional regulator [Celeribacter ethanolicus]TNE69324.1 MAG: Rrf2 family transcriptional regulator [Paracoccaceae bacterium]